MNLNDKNVDFITEHLQDDISKTIYANRIFYAITGDKGYLRNICMTIPEGKDFVSILEKHADQEKILFGAGRWGGWIKETFNNITWDYLTDNNISDRIFSCQGGGIPIISVDELVERHKDAFVVITSKFHWCEMQKQLLDAGFQREQLYLFGKAISNIGERIYFDLPELPHRTQEIFIDAGGYDGMTSFYFSKWATGKWRIKIFEPEPAFQKKCRDTLLALDNVEIVPKGLWNETAILSFETNGSESKIVSNESSEIKVPVISLDEYLDGDPVTFIKMDIEGSELNAIKGASETIRKYKPKLAVSVYHKPEDIIEIPKLLLELNKEYRFWIRHYSLSWFDTVLYAI